MPGGFVASRRDDVVVVGIGANEKCGTADHGRGGIGADLAFDEKGGECVKPKLFHYGSFRAEIDVAFDVFIGAEAAFGGVDDRKHGRNDAVDADLGAENAARSCP